MVTLAPTYYGWSIPLVDPSSNGTSFGVFHLFRQIAQNYKVATDKKHLKMCYSCVTYIGFQRCSIDNQITFFFGNVISVQPSVQSGRLEPFFNVLSYRWNAVYIILINNFVHYLSTKVK